MGLFHPLGDWLWGWHSDLRWEVWSHKVPRLFAGAFSLSFYYQWLRVWRPICSNIKRIEGDLTRIWLRLLRWICNNIRGIKGDIIRKIQRELAWPCTALHHLAVMITQAQVLWNVHLPQVRSTFGKSKSRLQPLTCHTCSRVPDISKYSKCARCSKITQGCSTFKSWNHNILACYWYILYLGQARCKCSCIQELNCVWMWDSKKL